MTIISAFVVKCRLCDTIGHSICFIFQGLAILLACLVRFTYPGTVCHNRGVEYLHVCDGYDLEWLCDLSNDLGLPEHLQAEV